MTLSHILEAMGIFLLAALSGAFLIGAYVLYRINRYAQSGGDYRPHE